MAQLSDVPNFEQALELRLAGRLIEAQNLCQKILAITPADVRALNMLGAIARLQHKNELAIDYFRRSIAINPGFIKSHLDLGEMLEQAGQLDEAITAFRQAVTLNPELVSGHLSIGNVRMKKAQFSEAVLSYQAAVSIQPDSGPALARLALALIGDHRYTDAIAAAEKAIGSNPNQADLHCIVAEAMGKSGQYAEAIQSYDNAIGLRPNAPKAYIDKGHLQNFTGAFDDAIATAEKVLAFKPDSAAAHLLKGLAFTEKFEPDNAIASYRSAIAIRPGLANAYAGLGVCLRSIGQINEAVEACRRAVELDPQNAIFHSTYVFTLNFHPDYDARAIADECRKWNVQHAQHWERGAAAIPKGSAEKRPLRIGFVSAEFDWHPVGWNLLPLFEHHDRERIELFCFSQVSCPDEVTLRLKKACCGWTDIIGLSEAQVWDKIREDKIDVLVDLSLHTSGNRLPIFAAKPAPVQATWLAYPGTTGLSAINFRISDNYLDAPDADTSVYSEKTFRLPETYWCYQPKPGMPETGPLPFRKTGHITFGCLNHFSKMSRPALDCWAKILQSVPNSTIILHAPPGSARSGVQAHFASMGIDAERIEFSARLPLWEYFELFNRIDIALDTFPFCGQTTTCDALWLGVPVISVRGKTVVGRIGHSILSNAGLSEWSSRTVEQYIEKAIELARDVDALEKIRRGLRGQLASSPIMQASRFAHNMEVALRHMWKLA